MVGDLADNNGSVILPALPTLAGHAINGTMTFSGSGGMTLGAGLYAIAGNVWLGAANGGGSVSGQAVTIAVTGSSPKAAETAPSGTKAPVVYIGAGYSNVTLTAPTSGNYKNVAMVGPLSPSGLPTSSNGGAWLDQGASNATVGGAFYFPNGPLTVSGGASIGNGTGQCLQIVASQITLCPSGSQTQTCSNGTYTWNTEPTPGPRSPPGSPTVTGSPCFSTTSGSEPALFLE